MRIMDYERGRQMGDVRTGGVLSVGARANRATQAKSAKAPRPKPTAAIHRPESIRKLANRYGLKYSTLHRWITDNPDESRESVAKRLSARMEAGIHGRAFNELCRQHGKNPVTVRYRVQRGLSLNEALTWEGAFRKPVADSIQSIARRHGLNVSTLAYYVRRYPDMEREAVAKLVKKRVKAHHAKMAGRPNIKKLAREHGVPASTLYFRVNKQGMTVEEALAKPIMKHEWSFRALCRKHGLNDNTVRGRMKRGMTLEEALSK